MKAAEVWKRGLASRVLRQREEIYLTALDVVDYVLRRRESLVPPRRLLFDGLWRIAGTGCRSKSKQDDQYRK